MKAKSRQNVRPAGATGHNARIACESAAAPPGWVGVQARGAEMEDRARTGDLAPQAAEEVPEDIPDQRQRVAPNLARSALPLPRPHAGVLESPVDPPEKEAAEAEPAGRAGGERG